MEIGRQLQPNSGSRSAYSSPCAFGFVHGFFVLGCHTATLLPPGEPSDKEGKHECSDHDCSGNLSSRSVFYDKITGIKRSNHRRCCNGISRSEEHTSELQSLMRISYAVF